MQPVGGGIFLYRYNPQQELEFLFVFDPCQKNVDRIGFEYPGGRIGPDKKNLDGNDVDGRLSNKTFDYKNPYTFLKGAVRETLEELVFLPAMLLQDKHIFNPDSNHQQPYVGKEIDKQYEKEAVDCIAQHIEHKNGLSFICKKNVFNEENPQEYNQMAVFFWNISDICPANLPEQLVVFRKKLRHDHVHLKSVDAEPVAFAWVKAKDIAPLLAQDSLLHKGQWITPSQFAAHDEKNNAVITDMTKTTKYVHAIHDGKILISAACMGMMHDRRNDIHNQQSNTVCIKQGSEFLLVDPKADKKMLKTKNKDEIAVFSSSMSAMIHVLQDKK